MKYKLWMLLLDNYLLTIFSSRQFSIFNRCLESHWFVWATQISHLPMPIDMEKKKDWVSMQVPLCLFAVYHHSSI